MHLFTNALIKLQTASSHRTKNRTIKHSCSDQYTVNNDNERVQSHLYKNCYYN